MLYVPIIHKTIGIVICNAANFCSKRLNKVGSFIVLNFVDLFVVAECVFKAKHVSLQYVFINIIYKFIKSTNSLSVISNLLNPVST